MTSPLSIALGALAVVAPVLAFAWAALRSRRLAPRRAALLGTFALGCAAFVPIFLVERTVARWTGVEPRASAPSDVATTLYGFLVAAPLEQSLAVLAVLPARRARRIDTLLDGVAFAAAAALGLASVGSADYLARAVEGSLAALRVALALPAHLFFAAMWGYALARKPGRRFGGRRFTTAWFLAAICSAIYDHIVLRRSASALVGAAPVLVTIAFLAFSVRGAVLGRAEDDEAEGPRSVLYAIAPPSLRAMREALLRTERPVAPAWIAFGALVTVGVMTASLAGAIALGRSIGVDFAAIDAPGAGAASTPPLALLGAAALAAFPLSGFLVARASSVRTVLEPALSSAAALVLALVLLGIASPATLVFALAFAPIAFGLACAGAWVGLGR
jgi:RsiW-degrading membrane proteinase PrsW (M82 family)